MKGCFTIQKNKKICSIIVLILAFIAFVGLAIVAIVAPMQYSKPVAGAAENDFTFFWLQGGDPFNMKAGSHTGTICYRIECNPITN